MTNTEIERDVVVENENYLMRKSSVIDGGTYEWKGSKAGLVKKPVRKTSLKAAVTHNNDDIIKAEMRYKPGSHGKQYFTTITLNTDEIYERGHTEPLNVAEDKRDKEIKNQLKAELGIDIREAENILTQLQKQIREQKEDIPYLNPNEPLLGEEKIEEEIEEVDEYSTTVRDKAMQLLKSGKAYDFIIEKHHSTYAGDDDRISHAFASVFASIHISTSAVGSHLKLSGSPGGGKNTVTKNFTSLVPPSTRLMTTPSAKNMFYNPNIKENMVIIIDEFENSDSGLIRTIKLSTGSFQETTVLDTLIDQSSVQLSIPKRVSFILLSVNPLDSQEMLSRFITVDVPDSIEYKMNVNKKQKSREYNLITENNEPDFDTQVCRCIYSELYKNVYDIRIPFADVIEWKGINQSRNWEIFADIIRMLAFYNINNREYFHKPGNKEVGAYFASYEDYVKAVQIYNKLASNNTTKLSDNEIKIIKVLIEARKTEIEVRQERDSSEAIQNINHAVKPADMEEVTRFGAMDIASIAKATKIPLKTVEGIIGGRKDGNGLTSKVVCLYSEKITIHGSNCTKPKIHIWYEGPEDEIMIGKMQITPRDICEAEAARCKQVLIAAWEEEESKKNDSVRY